MKNINIRFLSIKDIQNICNCSKYFAMKLKRDISESVGIAPELVTLQHLKEYLKLDIKLD